jgi:hypothetical protein
VYEACTTACQQVTRRIILQSDRTCTSSTGLGLFKHALNITVVLHTGLMTSAQHHSAVARHVQPVLTVVHYGCISHCMQLLVTTATATAVATAFTVCLDGFEKSDGKRALRLRLCGPGHYLHHKCILSVFKATGPKVTCYSLYH